MRLERTDQPLFSEQTTDELTIGWGDDLADDADLDETEARLIRERPPHWE